MSQRGGVGKNVWVAAILSASLLLSGYSVFSWIHLSHPIAAWISAVIIGVLPFLVWAVLLRQPPKTKLVVHRAVYGAGPQTDTDITETLRNAVQDGLVITVDNDLVPRDLAKGTRKRLEVQYSYGNGAVCYAYRPESTQGDFVRLVLPEDSELEKRAAEVKRLAEALEQTKLEFDRYKAEAMAATESQLPLHRPRVVPIRYGKQADGYYGLFIENSGESAFDVSVSSPVAIGDAKLIFDNDFPNLSKADGAVLLRAYIEKRPHDIDLGDLFEQMRSRGVDEIDFPIRYRDGDNRQYFTDCKIERDVKKLGGLAVRFIGQRENTRSDKEPGVVQTWTGPQVIVTSIEHTSEGMFPETIFTLHNASSSQIAQKVKVLPLHLYKSLVEFKELPLLGKNESKTVKPEVKNANDPEHLYHRRDFQRLMHAEWADATVGKGFSYDTDFSIAGVIRCEDLDGNCCETSFEICFFPKAKLLKEKAGMERLRNEQVVMEARGFRFKEVLKTT